MEPRCLRYLLINGNHISISEYLKNTIFDMANSTIVILLRMESQLGSILFCIQELDENIPIYIPNTCEIERTINGHGEWLDIEDDIQDKVFSIFKRKSINRYRCFSEIPRAGRKCVIFSQFHHQLFGMRKLFSLETVVDCFLSKSISEEDLGWLFHSDCVETMMLPDIDEHILDSENTAIQLRMSGDHPLYNGYLYMSGTIVQTDFHSPGRITTEIHGRKFWLKELLETEKHMYFDGWLVFPNQGIRVKIQDNRIHYSHLSNNPPREISGQRPPTH
jgi:hypothetical protein